MRIAMMKRLLIVALLCGTALLQAQDAPAPTVDGTTVTNPEPAPALEPTTTPLPPAPAPAVEPAKEPPAPAPAATPTPKQVPLRATEITTDMIRDKSSRNLPDALNATPGLFFREAGAALSYPVLRGMPSESVPIIFDGIALGGTVFTGGTGTWLSLLDRRLAERVTVKNGPDTTTASTTAAGGSVTITPFSTAPVRGNAELGAAGRFNTRFSSADTDRDAHARIAVGYGNFGALAAGSVAFTDMRMNGAGNEEPYSPFENYGAFFTGDWAFSRASGSAWHLSVGYLFAGMNDAADTTARQVPGETPDTVQLYDRSAHVAWGRLGMSLPASDLTGIFTVSYQNAVESIQTAFMADGRSIWRAREQEDTTGHTAGIAIDFIADVVPQLFSLRYGGAYYHDFIMVKHQERMDATSPLIGRGVAGLPDDSASDRFAGYLTGELDLISGDGPHQLTATAGYRFEGATLRAPQRGDINAINFTEPGHGFEAGIVYGWRKNLDLALTYGHGTRAPTLREAAYYGIREGFFFVPNGRLDAETTDTLDLTMRGRTKWLTASISGFTTYINDRIGKVRAEWNGADELQRFPVAGYANTGQALIWGITATEKLKFPFGLAITGGATYLWGEERLKNDDIVPLDHIPPLLWDIALRWDSFEPGEYQGFAEIAFRAATDPRPEQERDATAWQVLTLRGGLAFDEYIRVILTLENLLDRDYRTFQAGINGPGINAVLSLDADF